jgi:hypothetical protein
MERLAILPDRAADRPPEAKQEPRTEPPQRPGAPPEETDDPERLQWYTDYAAATDDARRQRKMMFIHFVHPGPCKLCGEFTSQTLSDPQVVQRLNRVVKARLPVDATIRVESREVTLLEQPAFSEMLGRDGIAIIDFAHPDAEYYGQVVSTFPFLRGRPYTAEQTAAILDLPPGTLTQRTLIYAVRVHPDRPASTQGKLDSYLLKEASLHSRYQARIRLQGHHQWNRRFHRINARLPQGLLASEVCAESWPGENLVEAAIECVRCWRLSSGHWGAVRAPHPVYAYDIKRGSNGIWYATGIFGQGS